MLPSASRTRPRVRDLFICSSCLFATAQISKHLLQGVPLHLDRRRQSPTQFFTNQTVCARKADKNIERKSKKKADDKSISAVEDNAPTKTDNVKVRRKSNSPVSKSKATLAALRASLRDQESKLSDPSEDVPSGNDLESTAAASKAPRKGGKKAAPKTTSKLVDKRATRRRRNKTEKPKVRRDEKKSLTVESTALDKENYIKSLSRTSLKSKRTHDKDGTAQNTGNVPIRQVVSRRSDLAELADKDEFGLIELVRRGKLSDSAKAAIVDALRATLSGGSLGVSLKEALQNGAFQASPHLVRRGTGSSQGNPTTENDAQLQERLETLPKLMAGEDIETMDSKDLALTPIDKGQLDVPRLSYGLERVLFNPGVYQLQDPRSRVFNFDPYLQNIMPVSDFDFSVLKEYITSSRDETLLGRAKEEGKRYTGSTSSMGSALGHFHFLLSQWRPVNTQALSKMFPVEYDSFTALQRAPVAIFLRWRDGVYAIDADKQYDSGNILMSLGKSMEKLLTMPTENFEKYRKENSHQVEDAERNDPEMFHYSTLGDFLLRSQLDAHDPRLPGTGMFDLKTRAVISIRMDTAEYEMGRGYEIRNRLGEWQSYEREYYDMIRAAFLKYSMQVRMGRMDGIFVAFHNTERIFGFQYISLPEMDYCIHGTDDLTLGDSEFKLSLNLLNRILDKATQKFPEKTLRLHFETRASGVTPFMYIFAEPVEESEVEQIQATNRAEIEKFEREVLGLGVDEDGWANMRGNVEDTMLRDEIAPDHISHDEGESSAAWNNVEEEEEDEHDEEEEVEEEEEGEDDPVDEETENEVLDDDLGVEEDHVEHAEPGKATNAEGKEVDEFPGQDLAATSFESGEEGTLDNVDSPRGTEDKDISMNNGDQDIVGEDVELQGHENIDELVEDLYQDHAAEDSDVANGDKTLSEATYTRNSHKSMDELSLGDGQQTPNSDDSAPAKSTGGDSGIFEDSDFEHGMDGMPPVHPGLPIDEHGALFDSLPDQDDDRPLLAMTLTIRNKVNGQYVVRPENLKRDDDWTIEYSLAEIDEPIRARNLQAKTLMRRKKALTKDVDITRDDPRNDAFIKNIQRAIAEGKKYREEVNEMEKTQPRVVLDIDSTNDPSHK